MRLPFYILMFLVVSSRCERPNILLIQADDMGWGDVSCHGSDQIMTPNIDVLAYHGVMIPDYYTETHGTPSRSALFTGKYPIRMGTQGVSIASAEDRGLLTTERLLPSYLQELGYATHLIGKWDLGKSREHYLPTNRGFDTFYGFLSSSVDYYTYNRVETWNDTTVLYGLDFFNKLEPVQDQRGHLTDVLTDRAIKLIMDHDTSVPLYLHIAYAAPHTGGGYVNLQTPEEDIAANHHIAHSARRLFAGLVTSLDRSVGHVIRALAERGLLQNTIVVFVSDNGASCTGVFRNFGSNLPLRGTKGTPWEGAVRTTALIWHASLEPKIYTGLFHVTDWLPTLMAAAGGNCNEAIDGFNQWNAITKDEPCPRQDVLITMNDIRKFAAFRDGKYKIIIGKVPQHRSLFYGLELTRYRLPVYSYENVLLSSETARVFKETLSIKLDMEMAHTKRNYSNIFMQLNETNEELCVPTSKKGCLFDLSVDPAEENDLWFTHPELVKHLVLRLRMYWSELTPRHKPKLDLRANPALHNFIWRPWLRNDEDIPEAIQKIPSFPLEVTVGELEYTVKLKLESFRESFTNFMKASADTFVQGIAGLFSF